ncbi:23S rRNA (pseudouridine(1915)-N(3))-methyltransferase RlmH [Roseivivax sediminis]|uniref:Ribosomal RNA large subunit methyltransferase H n=1 Tax=Roseivivax sediminis TaxID=936889 RepID=A0A1I2AZ93_9RHOB|nr:23S rRNA (pseudouridine(1915)-N(3))-methyltransferase RlmH [Roseivivax sediminis]SFE49264.1 23S rRNA (pseudouridine1915-N3)-methyltransferase [Roseivivax sediminis]
MRIHLCAVGRLRKGPERDLVDDYLARFDKTGRGMALGPAREIEVEDRKGGGQPAEAALLRKAATGTLCTLDESGRAMSSPDLAALLEKLRDTGTPDLSFVIGGADGIAPALLAEADLSLSFGAMVWPHALARVMLAEQLYRAASILAGTPYHRA